MCIINAAASFELSALQFREDCLATVFCAVICCKYSEANPSILQHAVFIIKYMLDIAIPDVPHRIGIAMRKVCISY